VQPPEPLEAALWPPEALLVLRLAEALLVLRLAEALPEAELLPVVLGVLLLRAEPQAGVLPGEVHLPAKGLALRCSR
jgi:hypothetical protein